MGKKIIFSNSIIIEKEENKYIDNLILEELHDNKNNNQGRIISNVGGFQSKGNNKEIANFLLHTSIKFLNKHYSLKNVKINFQDYWINENLKDNYNTPHVHPDCHFSGVYYVNVPTNSGSIKFSRNDLTYQYINLYNFFQNSDSYTSYEIEPENNLLIIFPSNFLHSVEPNLSNESRISVAFNLHFTR